MSYQLTHRRRVYQASHVACSRASWKFRGLVKSAVSLLQRLARTHRVRVQHRAKGTGPIRAGTST